jgi:hypothetical protein
MNRKIQTKNKLVEPILQKQNTNKTKVPKKTPTNLQNQSSRGIAQKEPKC